MSHLTRVQGRTVEAEDGRVAEWVSGWQLGLTISEED